jgi:hypothetical protein
MSIWSCSLEPRQAAPEAPVTPLWRIMRRRLPRLRRRLPRLRRRFPRLLPHLAGHPRQGQRLASIVRAEGSCTLSDSDEWVFGPTLSGPMQAGLDGTRQGAAEHDEHHTYSTHTLYILYTYSIHTLYILYTYSIHTLYILYTYSIHTLYILYTYSIHQA